MRIGIRIAHLKRPAMPDGFTWKQSAKTLEKKKKAGKDATSWLRREGPFEEWNKLPENVVSIAMLPSSRVGSGKSSAPPPAKKLPKNSIVKLPINFLKPVRPLNLRIVKALDLSKYEGLDKLLVMKEFYDAFCPNFPNQSLGSSANRNG